MIYFHPFNKEEVINQILCDKLWNILKTLLPQDPVKRGKDVPKDPNFASKSTAHRWLQRWKKEGVFDQMLIHLLRQAQEEELTDCQRLMVDGSFSPCKDGR